MSLSLSVGRCCAAVLVLASLVVGCAGSPSDPAGRVSAVDGEQDAVSDAPAEPVGATPVTQDPVPAG